MLWEEADYSSYDPLTREIYVNPIHLKVGLLAVTVKERTVLILPDVKGRSRDGFVLVQDIKTGEQFQQNAYYFARLIT